MCQLPWCCNQLLLCSEGCYTRECVCVCMHVCVWLCVPLLSAVILPASGFDKDQHCGGKWINSCLRFISLCMFRVFLSPCMFPQMSVHDVCFHTLYLYIFICPFHMCYYSLLEFLTASQEEEGQLFRFMFLMASYLLIEKSYRCFNCTDNKIHQEKNPGRSYFSLALYSYEQL